MISLNAEEKCQDCPYFSPNAEKIDATTLGGDKNLIQTVYCGNKDFCNNIKEFLENRK